MQRKWCMQQVPMLMILRFISLSAILLSLVSGPLGTRATWADQPNSFHVLFTGDVTAHLEPSG